jgi:hypothetical protein
VLSPTSRSSPHAVLQGRKTLAEVDNHGHRLRFRGKPLKDMPDDVLQDLIAHELAHFLQSARGIRCVRQYADGRADFVDWNGDHWGGNLEIEEDADCTMTFWGFDPESIERWSLATGRIKLLGDEHLPKVVSRILRLGR